MKKQTTPLHIKAADLLGASYDNVMACASGTRSADEANRRLDELRGRARKMYKRLALELHPDRTGGDKAKAELFAALAEVWADLGRLHFRQTPRPTFTVTPLGTGYRVTMNMTSTTVCGFTWNTSEST